MIKETGWSQAQVAARFVPVGAEVGAHHLTHVTRSHISQWVLGSHPEGQAAPILCETLSRRLRRTVTPSEIGLRPSDTYVPTAPEWSVDTRTVLRDLGSSDLDINRRQALAKSA
ncbi:hypothetical protein [Streptomyces ehimensis]|uniref:Uncharacterized protein n=1 Tax=Streptomyces ehimensis TaxID=68195 RepID=A0ABV9BUT6_9ACTN